VTSPWRIWLIKPLCRKDWGNGFVWSERISADD